MKKQHTQKMTVRVTAQTAYNLERLMPVSYTHLTLPTT